MNTDGSRPLKAGLYGAGSFAGFVARALSQSPAVRVRTVASRTQRHADALARDLGLARAHESFSSLLADTDIDLIFIATPPAEHAEQAQAALAAGKHVMLEKPLATTVADGERLVASARACHRVLTVNHQMLYTPFVEALMLFNNSRLVGPLLRISVENIASAEGLVDEHWFWDKRLSGGIFVEHGVHFFDWCGRLAGETQRAIGITATNGRRENRVFASLHHESGAIASHYHGFVAGKDTERTRITIAYEGVDVNLDGWIATRMHMTGPGAALATTTIRRMLDRTVESVPDARIGFFFDAGSKERRYLDAIRASFADAARAIWEPGYVPRNAAERILPSLCIACAARESADNGRAVDLALRKSAARP